MKPRSLRRRAIKPIAQYRRRRQNFAPVSFIITESLQGRNRTEQQLTIARRRALRYRREQAVSSTWAGINMALGEIAMRSVKPLKWIGKINREWDDAKSSRSRAALTASLLEPGFAENRMGRSAH